MRSTAARARHVALEAARHAVPDADSKTATHVAPDVAAALAYVGGSAARRRAGETHP